MRTILDCFEEAIKLLKKNKNLNITLTALDSEADTVECDNPFTAAIDAPRTYTGIFEILGVAGGILKPTVKFEALLFNTDEDLKIDKAANLIGYQDKEVKLIFRIAYALFSVAETLKKALADPAVSYTDALHDATGGLVFIDTYNTIIDYSDTSPTVATSWIKDNVVSTYYTYEPDLVLTTKSVANSEVVAELQKRLEAMEDKLAAVSKYFN